MRAVALLRAQQRPKYVSWETHEFAEHKKFPVIDMELVLLMQKAGCTQMKIVENRARLGALQGERRKPLPRRTAASGSAGGAEKSGEEKKGGEEEKGEETKSVRVLGENSNSGGGLTPWEFVDNVAKTKEWISVEEVLKRGVGNPRGGATGGWGAWWDYHMVLDGDAAAKFDRDRGLDRTFVHRQ